MLHRPRAGVEVGGATGSPLREVWNGIEGEGEGGGMVLVGWLVGWDPGRIVVRM